MLKYVCKHRGFTLAEVLITLAIIGVVAAMTIPTLIDKINDKVNTNQKTVIEKRLVQGLNLYNTQENGLSGKQHASTYEFLQGLSKHFKMTSICDTANITDCFPYDKINYDDNGTTRLKNLSELITMNFSLYDEYYPAAAFITGSGVPFIVSLKKGCIDDPDQPMKEVSSCVAGIYDLNGKKTPNKVANDVITFNGAKIDKYIYEDADLKIISIHKESRYLTQTECNDFLKISGCASKDYRAGAEYLCREDGGTLPTMAQLYLMASKMYLNEDGTKVILNGDGSKTDIIFNENSKLAKSLDVNPNIQGFTIWAAIITGGRSYPESFSSTSTKRVHDYSGTKGYWALCVEPK